MKRKHKLLLLFAGFALVLVLLFCWLTWGRTVVLNLGGRNLDEVVDLSCFEGLHPDMTRSEVDAAMGQPWRMHVTGIDYDDEGEIEYQEICWSYEYEDGFLNYYVEEYDEPGGSVEYVPSSMKLDDFLRVPLKLKWGKCFVDIRGNQRVLMRIHLKKNGYIKKINWHWQQ